MASQTNHPELSKDELPVWMRRAMHRNDYGAWLVLILSALVGWYFVIGPNLPTNTGTENHVFRAAAYAEALQETQPYPRWDTTANGGYGAPIPHYSPPLAPYLSALIQVVGGQDAISAVRWVYTLAFTLAGGGVYGLVLRLRGAGAGIVAAMIYVTSPYFGLTSPHILGDLTGSLALGLVPVLLWSVHRLMTVRAPHDYLLTTAVITALLLTEPRIAGAGVIFAGILAAWLAATERRWAHLRLGLFAIGNAAVISAFYWLPVMLEQDVVRWEIHMPTTQPIFLTWQKLLMPFTQIDPSALIPQTPLMLGWVPIALGLVSLFNALRHRPYQIELLFVLLGVGVTILAVVAFPTQIWLLGIVSLCIALGTSAALGWRAHLSPIWQRWVLVFTLLVILGAAAPAWLPPAPAGVMTDTSAAARVQYEQRGYGVASVPPGDAYPTTLPINTLTNDKLINDYIRGTPLHINLAQLSNDVRASALAEQTHSSRYQVTTSESVTLPLLRAYFPGWRARLGQNPIGLAPNASNLLRVAVPPTQQGLVQVWLGGTIVRRAGWIIATLGLGLLAWQTRRQYQQAKENYHEIALLTQPETRLIIMIVIFSALIIFFTASPNARYSVRSQAGTTLEDITAVRSRTTTGLQLLGYDLPRTSLHPGDNLELNLFWETIVPLTEHYFVQVTVLSEDGQFAKATLRYPGGYPTTRWPTNRFVADPHYIALPAELPPGTYRLAISLYNCPTPQVCDTPPPMFFNSDGVLLGDTFSLPTSLHIQPRR